ncbi:FadR/GntR family transcriptional regulator [Devosia sp. XK-2]|uniref:FadR/GntR family transcriptional regulator n=1 Tax=Devosia sp. XK-2 TaxID=3126689 RepID=UPI0030D2AE26
MAIEERPPYAYEQGQSLAEVAHSQMLALIDDGSWSPRSRLPSETELARRFGMSRPVIRQALAKLRDAGLIQSRQGSGSFVIGYPDAPERAPETVSFPAIGSIVDITSFVAFREGMEGEIAATAALNRTPDDLAAIEATLERAGHHRSIAERSQDDFAFHLSVAKATGNPFYVNSLTSLREQMMMGMNLSWNLSAGSADYLSVALAHHRTILGAIRHQDADAAREAMREHLRWAGARMLRGDKNSEAAPRPPEQG